jgi:hypothetical protein
VTSACVAGACVTGACVTGACVAGACVTGACVTGACVTGACVICACVTDACTIGACTAGALDPGGSTAGAYVWTVGATGGERFAVHGSGSGIKITGRSRRTSFCMAITGDCTGAGIFGAEAAIGTGLGSRVAFGSGADFGSGGRFGSGKCTTECGFGCEGGCPFPRDGVGSGVVDVTGAGDALAAGISSAFL